MTRIARKLDPEELLWGFLSLASFFLTGIAAVVAIGFVAEHKPHVLAQTSFAYALVWALLVIYSRSYRSGRKFFSVTVWFVVVCFLAFLCFIHLDDAPPRTVSLAGVLVLRERAESLYWAVAFDAAGAVILTMHVLWLRRRIRRYGRVAKEEVTAEAQELVGRRVAEE